VKLSEGERVRLGHALDRLKATMEAMRIVQRTPGVPPGHDVGQALVQTAVEISNLLAKIDAYERCEQNHE
jgi:hypothetical protein